MILTKHLLNFNNQLVSYFDVFPGGKLDQFIIQPSTWDADRPKLFKVYTLPVGDIGRCHGLQYQIYADDNDLYIAFKQLSPDTLNRAMTNIESCVLDITRSWVAINFLKLNELKQSCI